MKPDFLISTDPAYWPGLTLSQRTRASLALAQRASERFYGVLFGIQGESTLGLQERDTEPLRARVDPFLRKEAIKILMEVTK